MDVFKWHIKSILFLIICFIYFINECMCSDMCKANNNEYYKIKTGKCRKCKGCKYGMTRDFTEKYNGTKGLHGDEECLPCRECTRGHYIQATGSTPPQCIKCRDCASLHRDADLMCDLTHDMSCGSCKPGFYDAFGNTDLPCLSNTSPSPGKKDQSSLAPLIASTRQVNEKTKSGISQTTAIIIITVGCIICICILVLIIVCCRRQYARKRLIKNSTEIPKDPFNQTDVLRDSRRNFLEDSDLEPDMPPDEAEPEATESVSLFNPSMEIRPRYARTHAPVHNNRRTLTKRQYNSDVIPGELDHSYVPSPHPELSHMAERTNYEGMQKLSKKIEYFFHDIPRGSKCTCSKQSSELPKRKFDHISLEDNDYNILNIVSNKICHEPKELFRDIGVQDNHYYQINNDRDRDPDNVTQQEFIFRVLKRWARAKGKSATIKILLEGLHTAQFHNIIHDIDNIINPDETILKSSP